MIPTNVEFVITVTFFGKSFSFQPCIYFGCRDILQKAMSFEKVVIECSCGVLVKIRVRKILSKIVPGKHLVIGI